VSRLSVVPVEPNWSWSIGPSLGKGFAQLLREEKPAGASSSAPGVGWSSVRMGNLLMRGGLTASTTVIASGLTLFGASVGPDDALLVDADLYGPRARRLGTFRANRPVSRAQPQAELAATANHVLIRNAATGHVILSASCDDRALVIAAMDLWTRDGQHCELDNDGVLMTSSTHQAEPARSRGCVLIVPLRVLDLLHLPFA
jgi:hypothetical protein